MASRRKHGTGYARMIDGVLSGGVGLGFVGVLVGVVRASIDGGECALFVLPLIYFALGSVPGAIVGCWVALRLHSYRGAGRTAAILAILAARAVSIWLLLAELATRGGFNVDLLLIPLLASPVILLFLALGARALALR